MAHFIRGTETADKTLTPLKHSNDIYKESLKRNPFINLMGKKDSNQPIVVESKHFQGMGSGDTRRFHFIPQNKSDGIHGQNATILGNEDTLDEYSMDIGVDQEAKAFAKKGKMTDKRIIWDFRKEAKNQLINWFGLMYPYWIAQALTGYMSDGQVFCDDYDAEQVVHGDGRLVVPDGASGVKILTPESSSNTTILGGYTDNEGNAGTLKTTDKMTTYVLDILQEVVTEGNPTYRMRPLKSVNGKDFYIMLLSLAARRQLRQDTRFEKRMDSLIQGGADPEKDIFARGALGIWDNIILMPCEYIYRFYNGAGAPFDRNLLLGSNAMVQAFAQTIDYTEERTDHKRKLSCAADVICGHKKTRFDDVDMNVIQVVTSGAR